MSHTRFAAHLQRLSRAVTVVVVLGPSSVAFTQEPPVVGVSVEVNVPALRRLWREERVPAVTAGVRNRLVAKAGELWRCWTVSPDPPEGAASLVFLVEEVVAPRIDVRLELRRGARAVMSWPAVWKAPADLSLTGYPTFPEAEAALTAAFQDRLLIPKAHDVFEGLKRTIPVAQSAQWVGPPAAARIVIPLAWERYKHLRKSVFRVICEWPGRGDAVLNSWAPGISATFLPPDSAETASFPAVLLVPREREYLDQRRDVESVKEELDQLRLKAVFLKELVDPDEWDIAPPASGGNS